MTNISINVPAEKVESLPIPPYVIFKTVCPIIPQPAIPPKKPAVILAKPCPILS